MDLEKALWRERPKTEEDGLKEAVHDTLVALHNGAVEDIYSDFKKEKDKLEKDRDYWKLSFSKQVEAGRKNIQCYQPVATHKGEPKSPPGDE